MQWLGKFDIIDPSHVHDLERMSATYEMHNGLNKDQSDQLAYNYYRRQQMVKAAAFHLDGMAQAKARGDKEAEKSHYGMYALHCQALNTSPMQSILPEINAHRGQIEPLAKFVGHPADIFATIKQQ